MHQILIDGSWVAPETGVAADVLNPATLKAIASVVDCDAVDIARAVAAAVTAQPAWQARPRSERVAALSDLAAELRARAFAIAALLTQETGKPLVEACDCVEWAAENLSAAAKTSIGADAGPVVAVLPTVDFPLLSCARLAVGALAGGRSVVIRAPATHPLAILEFSKILAKLPAGTVNVVTGGAHAAAALLGRSGVSDGQAFLTLWGRRDAGRLALDPILVCGDADLDVAAAGVAWARLVNGGQTIAASRTVLVETSVSRDFADRLHSYVAFLEAGNPSKSETDLGPLLSHEAVRDLEARVARSTKDGAVLKLGGRAYKPWGLSGHFFQPTVLSQVLPGNSAVRDPMRGPVIALTPVADVAAAVEFLTQRNALEGLVLYAGPSAGAVQAALPSSCDVDHVTSRRQSWYPYAGRARAGG